MHNPEHLSSKEELQAREADLRQRITVLDAAGDHGDEWNRLSLEYEQIQAQLEALGNDQEQIAA